MKRIFVRGMSRSGGTLMVTILDAHPQVAMCYEVYPHLLEAAEGEGDSLQRFREDLARAGRRRGTHAMRDRGFQTFTFRAERAGVSPARLLELLDEHAREGQTLGSVEGRLRFVERIGLDKARREGKPHWGTKMAGPFEQTWEVFPDASFLFMLRDGRDVAASRKHVGEFDQSMEEVARGWGVQIERFRRFAATPGVASRMVRYERLAREPRAELGEILEFLGLPWSDRVLASHDQDLTLFRNPAGHLSIDQVKRPINASSVGRWRHDLTEPEVAAFEGVAGPLLAELGYEAASDVASRR